MQKIEIRPGVSMAYEDHWFGEQWNVPETVVMVHGNSRILTSLDPLDSASCAQISRDTSGSAGLR